MELGLLVAVGLADEKSEHPVSKSVARSRIAGYGFMMLIIPLYV